MIKVLIVEDDPMVAFINKQYLEKIGNVEVLGPVIYEEDVIEILEREKVDLILLDVFLPKKSGIEILKSLRAKKYLVDVIIISAANSSDEIKKAFAYGAVDYLIKPFNYERFEESINKYKVRYEILNKELNIKQRDIDILYSKQNKVYEIPKGLNKLTLDKIIKILNDDYNKMWSIREIAFNLNISNVTVKKYMDYLEQIDKVLVETTYGNVGRPEFKYKLKKYINKN